MCEAAIAATAVDRILPLEQIGPFLATRCSKVSDDDRPEERYQIPLP
jgi:hypothetical protein